MHGSHLEFVEQAVNKGRPSSSIDPLPQFVKDTLFEVARGDQESILKCRNEFFRTWLAEAKALEKDEADLKAALPKHCAEILKGKRLLLWRSMLKSLNYDDVPIVDRVISGTELVGPTDDVAIFPTSFRPASITQSELSRKAPHIRRLFLNTVRSSGHEQLDREVFDQNMEVVAKGWISGPLDPSSVPSDSIISRRFGIRQGQKIRVIDDLSQSMINATVQVAVSPKPHTVDYVAAVCKFLSACSHPNEKWLGRSFDLKSAYRQLSLSERALQHSYMAVFDPQKQASKWFSD